MKRPITIFYVYAQTDEALRQQLEMHLALLRRQGVLANWQESQAGALWEQEREEGFKEAALILLLISADFLASDVCYEQQMQQALGRERQGEVKVLPILLRPVEMTNAPFMHLPMVPTNAKPVTLWSNQDVAWAHIAEGIRCVLEEKLLPVVLEPKEAARYTTKNQQAMDGPIIGEHDVIHHHYPPVSPPPDTTASPMKPIWMVPYPRNPFFTGRNEVLDDLHQRYARGQVQAVSQPQAMNGLGGIGKTQIAVEYAYRYRQEYHMVLWAQANMRENLTSSYLSIAKLLSLPEKGEQDSIHVIIAVKNWLQRSTSWLLILDNADELVLVRDFLPPSFGGHVLLTTRAQATGHFARRLEVGIFPMELGALFLLHRTGLLAQDLALEQASKQERDLARAICEELGGLPLALDQAGAYIEETTCSLLEYQQRYRIHRARLLKRRGRLVTDHPESVATTWSLAFEKIEQTNPVAADLLRLCAFLAPDAIPEEIVTKGASHLGSLLESASLDMMDLDEAIAALGAYSLVRRDTTEKTLSIHRLVQAVLKDDMDASMRSHWALQTLQAINATFPEVKFETWLQCERCLSHALICVEVVERENFMVLDAAFLLHRVGTYLIERARSQEAQSLLQQALVIEEQHLGPEDTNRANTIDRLARCFENQGKYAEAEPLYMQALEMYERGVGATHPETARSLNNLALLYYHQGKSSENKLKQRGWGGEKGKKEERMHAIA